MVAMETRLQVVEKNQDTNQTSQQGDFDSRLTLNKVVGKLDIKPIKDEMKKIIDLDRERNKRALNLIILGLKEEVDEDTIAIAQTKLRDSIQIEMSLTGETRLVKLTENRGGLI